MDPYKYMARETPQLEQQPISRVARLAARLHVITSAFPGLEPNLALSCSPFRSCARSKTKAAFLPYFRPASARGHEPLRAQALGRSERTRGLLRGSISPPSHGARRRGFERTRRKADPELRALPSLILSLLTQHESSISSGRVFRFDFGVLPV